MAKDKITDYSATNASNSDVGGINIAESCPAGNLNNAAREVMTHLAETNAGTYPVADTWTFGDPADLTKRVRLDAGGVTAGQTRVLTAPDFNGTIATLAGTETFSNKTLASPVLILKNGASEAPTDEADARWDSDDDALVIGTGGATKTFRANGWQEIETINVTSATAYSEIVLPTWARRLRISGYFIPATNGSQLWMRVAVAGTINSTAGAYTYQFLRGDNTTVDALRDTASQTAFVLMPGASNNSNGGGDFRVDVGEVNQTRYTYYNGDSSYLSSGGNLQRIANGGGFLSASALTHIRFLASSGDMTILHAVVEGHR